MTYSDDASTGLHTVTEHLSGEEPDGPGASLLLYHRDGSQMVPLHDGQAVIVGRARPADVPVRDPSLSRQHARFEYVNGELWVEDLGSTNGTRVNGKKIARAKIKATDAMSLGGVSVAFHAFTGAEGPGAEQGLESHDTFLGRLEEEVVRARTFGRKVAVLMVRAARRKQAHIGRWGPRVRGLVREVDTVALYDQGSVMACLPELSEEGARDLGRAIVERKKRGDPQLLVGVAVFPDHAASADELVEVVRTTSRRATGRQPVQVAAGGAAQPQSPDKPLVVSPKMRAIFETARRVADAEIPVLIYGETGTGKEVLARTIHGASKRRRKPLRCINCAAIPETLIESALFGHEKGAFTSADRRAKGVFEEAAGGAVLLDEIGELSAAAQAALLRVLETRTISRVGSSKEISVDVRIIAATHRDLERMCQEDAFRWDLYYRLETMVIRIPPLRERPEEILPLAERFMRGASKANHCKVETIAPDARLLLEAHGWPGNVRELRNTIARAVVIAQDATIVADDLPSRVRRPRQAEGPAAEVLPDEPGLSIKEKVKRYEAQLLLDALAKHDWNQTKTAEALEIPLRTLVHKMKQYGLRKRYE
jgi:DNA-binding NtrC family response regulator